MAFAFDSMAVDSFLHTPHFFTWSGSAQIPFIAFFSVHLWACLRLPHYGQACAC